MGHIVEIHKITPSNGKERGDIEVKDCVVLPRGPDNRLTPRPLILDFTMTYESYGRSHLYPIGQITRKDTM